MPLGRSAAHKIRVSALELAKTLISKEALKSFQRGVGFLIRWQFRSSFVNSACGVREKVAMDGVDEIVSACLSCASTHIEQTIVSSAEHGT